MTTYVIWLVSTDEEFRPAYISIVEDEAIQPDPLTNEEGTQYCIGSSKITAENVHDLGVDFPSMTTSDTLPPEFIHPDSE